MEVRLSWKDLTIPLAKVSLRNFLPLCHPEEPTCLRQVKDGMNGAKRFAVFSVPTTIARQLLVGTVSQPAFAKVQVAWYRFNHA